MKRGLTTSWLPLWLCVVLFCTLSGCETPSKPDPASNVTTPPSTNTSSISPTITSIIILGTTQDAGSPQIGCTKACCKDLFDHPDPKRKVVSLAIIDPKQRKKWLIEATPDLPAQMRMLHILTERAGYAHEVPDGIFLTHAHMGHYTGLLHLGREAMNAKEVPVYAMPRMRAFLETNGPWSQLITLHNIALLTLQDAQVVQLGESLAVTPILVPHRDEFSETVGYEIDGPEKKALFIPDIDKWEKWPRKIEDAIAQVDYALLDATFYDSTEIPGRNMAEIPHPFVKESLARFQSLPSKEKNKIYFIHMNHTNPLLREASLESKKVEEEGYHVARMGTVLEL